MSNGIRLKIRILVTGGTFDKEYNEIDGSLSFKETHLTELLELGRCKADVTVRTLMMIDSLDMTAAHRQIILDQSQDAVEDKIVITHGTDTMVETAKVLGVHRMEKTVVLTGAMIPFKFGSSDGLFNMGAAIALAQSLPHGVYIAMNGKYFHWDNVQKNKKLGIFEELSK
ncbi:MAG: asparaginase domain-containing protein [Proteobacteria bacterium]|nr:asparaginase domain-containing protein [Pseudomonadota bacterium]